MEPTTYIAFLRAVNVGGRVVKMERLRELFTELGLRSVRSYIQSGNIFFETERTDRAALTREIAAHLEKALGYEVGVMLRTIPEVEALIALDPFREVEVTPDIRLYVIFLAEPVPVPDELPLRSPKGDCDIIAVTGSEILAVFRLVNGRPTDPSAFLGKTFGKVDATTRFFHTTEKILRAAKGE
jgi:uncharacterized protein (DUF1697 family)